MKYTHPKGPALHAIFHFSGESLSTVTLDLRDASSGMTWEFISSPSHCEQEGKICRWMEHYCLGGPLKEEFSLDLFNQSAWTQRVLEALQQVPFGQSMSYQDLAVRIGRPAACRAVGTACGKNPFPLLIGCHRILASGKSNRLGGFSCGLEIKRRLLTHEKITFA